MQIAVSATSTFSDSTVETHMSSPMGDPSNCAWEGGAKCAPGSETKRVPHVVISLLRTSHFAVVSVN